MACKLVHGAMLAMVVSTCRGFVARINQSSKMAEQCMEAHEWLRAWNATQTEMLSGRRRLRAIFVVPHPSAGLGNRVRALAAALFLGRVVGAVIVYQDDVALLRYLRPNVAAWDPRLWPDIARAQLSTLRQRRVSRHEGFRLSQQPLLGDGEALTLVAWNDDPSAVWRRRWHIPDSVTDASCRAVTLFRATLTLERALDAAKQSVGSPEAGIHLRTNREFQDRDYVLRKLESRRERRPGAAKLETCDACWLDVGLIFAACAKALSTSTLIVSSDDENLVADLLARISATALPPYVRSHSGLTRPNASNPGPFLDLFLLANTHIFVGTAGSSYSSLVATFGGFAPQHDPSREFPAKSPLEENFVLRTAYLFRTPFVKGVPISDTSALDLPTSPGQATQYCRSLAERSALPEGVARSS